MVRKKKMYFAYLLWPYLQSTSDQSKERPAYWHKTAVGNMQKKIRTQIHYSPRAHDLEGEKSAHRDTTNSKLHFEKVSMRSCGEQSARQD